MSQSDLPTDWQTAMLQTMTESEYLAGIKEYQDAVGVELPDQLRHVFTTINEILNSKEGSPFNQVSNRDTFNDKAEFYKLINENVQEKLAAVFYHFTNYSQLEALAIGLAVKLIHKLPKWQSPQTLGLSTRRLDFETEAFIFQARACLDQFTRSVAYYFKNHCNNILKLKKLLERNYSSDPKAVGIVATIGRHSSLVDGLVSSRGKTADRDVIAHLGKLSFRPLNVILFPSGQISILPHIEGKRVPPSDFSSKSQRDVMEDVMKDLSGLIVETYDILFDGKLGPASSAK